MNKKTFVTPESTIFRKIDEELVVVQADTAHYYFFNPETEVFLNYFKKPGTVESFCESADIVDPDHLVEIHSFCRGLLEKGLLNESELPPAQTERARYTSIHPKLIREGETTIDKISFLCP